MRPITQIDWLEGRTDQKTMADIIPLAAVCVRDLTKSYGKESVLHRINFNVREGEILVLLGPSGSGKSTTLRLIAGLETPDSGEIWLHGRRVDSLRSRERNVGVIFQQYALFPQMTVEENIAFGLMIRKKSRREIQTTVNRLLEMVRLNEHRSKMPSQLSGGQQQRVAIARALAYGPEVLLFDEPFAALDEQNRARLRREIRALLKNIRIPAIFITHDQEEALELADHIAVLNRGRIEQIGTPAEIYSRPQTEFVATFLGAANILAGRVSGGWIELGALRLALPEDMPRTVDGDKVKVIFRPEDVIINGCLPQRPSNHYLGRSVIGEISFIGSYERLTVNLNLHQSEPELARPVAEGPPSNDSVIITVTRPRWEAEDMPLGPGQQITIGLSSYTVLPEQASDHGAAGHIERHRRGVEEVFDEGAGI